MIAQLKYSASGIVIHAFNPPGPIIDGISKTDTWYSIRAGG